MRVGDDKTFNWLEIHHGTPFHTPGRKTIEFCVSIPCILDTFKVTKCNLFASSYFSFVVKIGSYPNDDGSVQK